MTHAVVRPNAITICQLVQVYSTVRKFEPVVGFSFAAWNQRVE